MKKYKMIQLEESAYLQLKEYCILHDKKMGKTVAKLITQLSLPSNRLKSTPK